MKKEFRTVYYAVKSVLVGVTAFVALAVIMVCNTPVRWFEAWLDDDNT